MDAITLFRSIIMFYGTDIILQNILHIHIECRKYSMEYCQSHITLLWIWIILWPLLYILIKLTIILEIEQMGSVINEKITAVNTACNLRFSLCWLNYRDHAIDFILIETFPLECCQSINRILPNSINWFFFSLFLYIDGLCMKILVQFKG